MPKEDKKPLTVRELKKLLGQLPSENDNFPVVVEGCDCDDFAFSIEVSTEVLIIKREH